MTQPPEPNEIPHGQAEAFVTLDDLEDLDLSGIDVIRPESPQPSQTVSASDDVVAEEESDEVVDALLVSDATKPIETGEAVGPGESAATAGGDFASGLFDESPGADDDLGIFDLSDSGASGPANLDELVPSPATDADEPVAKSIESHDPQSEDDGDEFFEIQDLMPADEQAEQRRRDRIRRRQGDRSGNVETRKQSSTNRTRKDSSGRGRQPDGEDQAVQAEPVDLPRTEKDSSHETHDPFGAGLFGDDAPNPKVPDPRISEARSRRQPKQRRDRQTSGSSSDRHRRKPVRQEPDSQRRPVTRSTSDSRPSDRTSEPVGRGDRSHSRQPKRTESAAGEASRKDAKVVVTWSEAIDAIVDANLNSRGKNKSRRPRRR